MDFLLTQDFRHRYLDGTQKPSEDIVQICGQSLGFQTLRYAVITRRVPRIAYAATSFTRMLSSLKKGDCLWVQYPIDSSALFNAVRRRCEQVGARFVLIVHDVRYLRKDFPHIKEREIMRFNQADVVIVHNRSMVARLAEDGVRVPMVSLEIFDYLVETDFVSRLSRDGAVIFAGNLSSTTAGFLRKMDAVYPVNAYGPTDDESFSSDVTYHGVFAPEQLAGELEGSFSLIWNGEDINCCGGDKGEYLRFNNPYKVSMSLAEGVPVIIWDQAAMSSFVESKQVGFTVSSLLDIKPRIQSMSEEEYCQYVVNARKVGSRLRDGSSTSHAIAEAKKIMHRSHVAD